MVKHKGMNPKLLKKWINALRSGKYKQGKGNLYKKKGNIESFCCLGVLACVAGVPKSEIKDKGMLYEVRIGGKCISTPQSEILQVSCARRNDGRVWVGRQSFKQIANWLESKTALLIEGRYWDAVNYVE